MANGINQDIAVVGSPSTNTELTIDLLQEAIEERLVGALTAFTAIQNGSPITAVGQVIGIELKNRWHEDSVFRNLVKRTGEIPPITNRQDTRVASLVVGATFKRGDKGYEPDVLGMVPSTGTRIARVDQALLDQLLSVYQKEIFYLGRAYANDVLYPMWFKHFGSGPGGAGEAYHLAIFGKTGSGKSVLAKNILLAYAQHKPPRQMGLLVIDPQGEFSRDFGSGLGTGSYKLDYKRICTKIDREVVVRRVPDIRLDRWNLFADLISRTQLFPRLTIRTSDWIRNAADVLSERLKEEKVKLTNLHKKESYETALKLLKEDRSLKQIYSGKEGRERLKEMLDDAKVTTPLFEEAWLPVTKLFRETDDSGQRRPVTEEVIDLVLRKDDRCIVIMDLSGAGLSVPDKQTFWSEEVQALLLSRITEALIRKAEELYGKESLNALVILDEAHRLAGTEYFDDDSDRASLRKQLIDGVRTTRKYGLGWMFISQSLASIHKSIVDQCRILSFGFGLAIGDEFRRLKEFAGGDERSMELYRSFRDPASFPREELREFPFMAVGPVSPLAFSGRPLFFTAFTKPDEFLKANKIAT
ncbi:MAG: ATP-binding protein [Nitrospira sp.]|nr:ATP-binding protein [Nitrospira sp.]